MIDAISKAVGKALIATALIASIAYAWPNAPTDPGAVRNNSGNTVLYDHRHECWTGTQPAHVEYPGHVIMRVEDGIHGGKWFYGGKRWVDIALIDVLEKDNPDVFVVAFCE